MTVQAPRHAPTKVSAAAASGAAIYEDDDLVVRCTQLKHRVPAYGYRVETRPRPGRFDVEKARALGIPPGPIYAELKAGRNTLLVKICQGPQHKDPEVPNNWSLQLRLCDADGRGIPFNTGLTKKSGTEK